MERDSRYGELDVGDMLADRFCLSRYIGRGAMGHVWMARDTHLDDEVVACKVLDRSLIDDHLAISELKHEVLVSRRLHHPYIVAVYTFWVDSSRPFITMECVEGNNLSQALEEQDAPFPLDSVVSWTRIFCEALDYAHSKYVLHRDIKPANILMGIDGSIRLADFGVARTLHELENRLMGHAVSGTVMYMSPEQLLGKDLDHRTDLYSLAATVYELLKGTPPFYDGAIAAQVQMRPPEPIQGLPEGVNNVLLKALAKRPEDRYPNCGAFYRAFAEAAGAALEQQGGAPVSFETTYPRHDPDAETMRLQKNSDMAGRRLGELLVHAAVITEEQLLEALTAQKETKERLGEILTWMGYADERAIALALAEQLQIPFFDLATEQVNMNAARMLDPEHAVQRRCLPVGWVEDRLVVAMADPLDFTAIDFVETHTHQRIDVCVATPSAVVTLAQRVFEEP
jgi:tRNA A-37 threonylcarbamoyl transferase component Bud32